MSYPYWQFFLAIESDLEKTTRYVEMKPDNFNTYSIEYARILISTGSEIDVLCKVLCQRIDPSKNPGKIHEYRDIITARYSKLHSAEVTVPRYGITLHPWENWERSRIDPATGNRLNPTWWRSYNDVKHHRDTAFDKANLENTLNAVAGLLWLVLLLYEQDLSVQHLGHTWLTLFSTGGDPGYYLTSESYQIPDLS